MKPGQDDRDPVGIGEDPLRALVVDRVDRGDGRYLLYYRWEAPEPGATQDATSRETPRDDDV